MCGESTTFARETYKYILMQKNIAVLLAGGVGARFGAERPKQLLQVAGQTVLEHSVEAFQRAECIDELAVVVHAQYLDEVRQLLQQERFGKLRHVVAGGRERYDSSLAALQLYEGQEVNLLLHDAVRPGVSQRLIAAVCAALEQAEVVNVALPVVDTIVEMNERGELLRIPPRERLLRVQTPQAFRREVLAEAYQRALSDVDFKATDDCSVVHRYLPHIPIAIVEGEERNLKLTHPEDWTAMERILQFPQ